MTDQVDEAPARVSAPDEGLPTWVQRLVRERAARGWTPEDAARAMRTHADAPVPADLADRWRRWEVGATSPEPAHRTLVAAALGTVVESIFPTPRPDRWPTSVDALLAEHGAPARSELGERLRRGAGDDETVGALGLVVEQLCCEYVVRPALGLIEEARRWLGVLRPGPDATGPRPAGVVDAAGWLTLLVGCLEYDTGRAEPAEASRRTALELARESGNAAIAGWAHEMRAWFALTSDRHEEAIDAAHAGLDVAPGLSVAVQLHAQEAKAWARLGERRAVTTALEKGRVLLDGLPAPARPEHHFVVDPDKFDFLAMDCHRRIGDDALASVIAQEVIRKTTGPGGRELSPMQQAEAEITLAVAAARRGEGDAAAEHGLRALGKRRVSGPSLATVAGELDVVLRERFPTAARTAEFRAALASAAGH